MRLNFILNAPVQLESGGTCVACLGGSLCCGRYQSHGPNCPAPAEYNFGHNFYNKNIIHLTKN